MKEILYIITGDKGEILGNLASVGKIVAGAVKSSNMGKIVYSTGGNKGTFLDAFKAYQSQKDSVRRLAQDIFQRAEGVVPNAEEVLKPLSDEVGVFGQRLKNIPKLTGKLPKSINKASNETIVGLVSEGNFLNIIGDSYGAKVVLNDLSLTQKLVKSLLKKHNAGDIKILGVENYHGNEINPYFDDKILSLISRNEGISIVNPVKDAGYTRVNINMLIKGVKTEFQVGGMHTTRFGEIEHFLYDMRGHGKADVSGLTDIQRKLFADMQVEYVKICRNKTKNKKYEEYLTDIWKTLKNAEEKNLPFPELPKPSKDLPEILSAENLFKLEKNVNL